MFRCLYSLSLLCSILIFASCGVDSRSTSPMTCTDHQLHIDCGGDIGGTWKLSCYRPMANGITITSPPEEIYAFEANGNYSFSGTGQDYVVNIPLGNFDPDGGLNSTWKSCSDANKGSTIFGGSCTTVADNCVCTYPSSGLAQNGTYTTSGTRVTTVQTFSKSEDSYCVNGNTLTLFTRFGNFPTLGVFTKQ